MFPYDETQVVFLGRNVIAGMLSSLGCILSGAIVLSIHPTGSNVKSDNLC
jgi:acyl-CoA synthetase (AMP-forming)/AMP-acid ligase II